MLIVEKGVIIKIVVKKGKGILHQKRNKAFLFLGGLKTCAPHTYEKECASSAIFTPTSSYISVMDMLGKIRFLRTPGGRGGGGVLKKFNTGRLCLEVQPRKDTPVVYLPLTNGTPFVYLPLENSTPFTNLLKNTASPF